MQVTQTVERVVSTVDRVQVVLTIEEAYALQDVLAHIGGNPNTTRRSLLQPLYFGLQEITDREATAAHDIDGILTFLPELI